MKEILLNAQAWIDAQITASAHIPLQTLLFLVIGLALTWLGVRLLLSLVGYLVELRREKATDVVPGNVSALR